MRKTLCASILLLALSVPALAGDATNPPAPVTFEDPPSATQPSGDVCADCWLDTEVLDPSADDFASAALTVLGSVLSLL